MNQFLHGVVRAMAESFDLPEPILEIGSYQVSGQDSIGDLRAFFPNKRYIGLDKRPGPGVDQVGDVEALPFTDNSIGTLISCSTFEHVPRFWRGFEEAERVLRADGALLVTCPFFFRIHNYPSDYWRFTPEALQLLLENYPNKIIGWHGTRNRPANVWALARCAGAPVFTTGEFEEYRTRLAMYARQPAKWHRKLRYRLARWFCGRGPFAPYLDQNRWETISRVAS